MHVSCRAKGNERRIHCIKQDAVQELSFLENTHCSAMDNLCYMGMFWDVGISGAEEMIHAQSPLKSASSSFTVMQFLSLKCMWFTKNWA